MTLDAGGCILSRALYGVCFVGPIMIVVRPVPAFPRFQSPRDLKLFHIFAGQSVFSFGHLLGRSLRPHMTVHSLLFKHPVIRYTLDTAAAHRRSYVALESLPVVSQIFRSFLV